MEYVDGKNALEWVKGLDKPLPIASGAQIGRHLLSALEYAHSKGYVHRDVKPSNLLVMGPVHRPRVKLTDFGLAKSFAETEGLNTLTRQGDVGGSIGFISPDHIRQFSDVREPADIYCAAATLFYLLTNKYPYLGFDPREPGSYEIILQHPPVPLRAFRPDAPEGMERVLLKALQKQPRDRWKSAQAMADALRPLRLAVVFVSWRKRHIDANGSESASLQNSIPVVVVVGDDLCGGDLAPCVKDRFGRARRAKLVGDQAVASLELGEGQQEAMDVGHVRHSLRRSGTIDHAYYLLRNQFSRRDHQNIVDDLVGRDAVHASHIHEVAVLRLTKLVQPMAKPVRHRPNPDGDLKSL